MTKRTKVSSFGFDRLAQIALVAVGLVLGTDAEVALAQETVIPSMMGDMRVVGDGTGNYVITAADGSIIEYNMFSLNANRTIQFMGLGGGRVLNRVVMFNPSMIDGAITADGRVYLVNPAGISIGPNGSVNASAFYAVAGNLSNTDFMNGVDHFTNLRGNLLVDAGGQITARDIYLIGKTIENRGSITGNGGGLIAMVTGNNDVLIEQLGSRIKVTVDMAVLVNDFDFNDPTRPPFVGVSNPLMTGTAQIKNSGTIRNTNGRVFLGAGDIGSFAFHNTNTGRVEMLGNGQIDMRAVDGLALNQGAIEANGDIGLITFKGPSVVNEGSMSANGGTGGFGSSGQVIFFGDDHAYLASGSTITALNNARVGSFDNNGITILQGTTGMAPGASVNVTGSGGLINIFGPTFIMNGSVSAPRGTTLLEVSGVGRNMIVSDMRMTDTLDLTPGAARSRNGNVWTTSMQSAMGAISLAAPRDIEINSTLTLDNDNALFLRSNAGNIHINAGIVGASDLTARAANNTIFVRVPLQLSDDAFFEAMAIQLDGGTLMTGGTQQYDGDVFLGADMMMMGTEVTFFKEVASRVAAGGFADLMIDANLTTFFGRVGGNGLPGQATRYLDSLMVMGTTQLNAESIRTNFGQEFLGAVRTAGDALFMSNMNGNIRFGGTLDGTGDLLIETGGVTSFEGLVGGASPFDSITTDAGGQSIIAANMITGTLTFGDAVMMGADATVTGTTAVSFNSTIEGAGHDLNIVSPDTTFSGNVANVGNLTTDADGVTNVNAASIQAQSISFGDDVVAGTDTSIFGNDRLNFDKTLNGGVNVRVGSNTLVRFGGDVGGTTALASLRIDSGGSGQISDNPIVVDGSLIRTVGDILINPNGRSVPALVATLAAMGNVLIKSENGNVFVGENEKLTSLGNLMIMANNGTATLNDLNAVNSISVIAGSIIFRAREAGTLLDFNGNTITDRGMEVIAGDSIFMSTTPTVIGNGVQPIFATRTGTNITGLGAGFSLRSFQNLTANQFRFNPILDLTLRADSDLAPAYDNDLEVRDRIYLDAIANDSLAAIGLNVRPIQSDDLLATVGGNQILIDTQRGGLTPGETGISANRLRRQSVLRVLDIHSRIFLPVPPITSEEEKAEFDRQLAARRQEIRNVLAEAWDDYTADGSGEDDPAGFRTYLAESGTHDEALTYLNGLEDIFRELWTMGVTPLDMQNCEEMVLVPVCPDTINPHAFRQAIGADLIG